MRSGRPIGYDGENKRAEHTGGPVSCNLLKRLDRTELMRAQCTPTVANTGRKGSATKSGLMA